MILKTVCVGVIGANCYICGDKKSKKGVVIDPGAEADTIISALKSEDLDIEYILITHGHFDHIGALDKVKEFTGAKVLIHEEGLEYLTDSYLNLSKAFFNKAFVKNADDTIKDGEIIKAGDLSFKVIHTPGHTLDGVNYYEENKGVLFSGDNLFKASIGRTDFPRGDMSLLVSSIKEKLLSLPDNVVVYPGHGEPTTIGYEKQNNIYLSANSWDE